MNIFGKPEKVFMKHKIILDKSYKLKAASLSLDSSVYSMSEYIKRLADNTYKVDISTPHKDSSRKVAVKKEAMLGFGLPANYIPAGRRISIQIYNPILDSQEAVHIYNRGKVDIVLGGEMFSVNKSLVDIRGIQGVIYTNPEGLILKAEFSGLEIVRRGSIQAISDLRPLTIRDLSALLNIPEGVITQSLSELKKISPAQ